MTTPVEASIVATLVLPLDHAPESPSELKVVEPSEHTASVPDKVPAFGASVTVPVADTVAEAEVDEPFKL